MRTTLIVLATGLLLAGCAHKDLKAPCAELAAFAPDVPCDERQPLNTTVVPSIFER